MPEQRRISGGRGALLVASALGVLGAARPAAVAASEATGGEAVGGGPVVATAAAGTAGSTVVAAAPGAASTEPAKLAELMTLARQALDQARLARLRPVPVAVKWSPKRIATLDVGGALGAMIGADLDGDKVPELYAVTDQAVIVYALSEAKVREVARLPFPGEVAAIRPRDSVATVAVDVVAKELMAGSSSYARSVRLGWKGNALVVLEELSGLPLCAHQRGQLVLGRNYFGEGVLRAEAPQAGATGATGAAGATGSTSAPSATQLAAAEWRKGGKDGGKDGGKEQGFYGQRCREDAVLSDGARARAVARLPVEGGLRVTVLARGEAGRAALPAMNYEVSGVGVAFDVGDVDRDGRIDVAYAGAGAPGDPDAVRVVPVSDPRRTLFRRAFTGGVAAVALVDLDGDGAHEVIAAVRLPGSPRVDLWRLN